MIGRTRSLFLLLTGVVIAGLAHPTDAASGDAARTRDQPSRKPAPGCTWERFSDAALHLEAWVQRCRFDDRTIDFLAVGHSLAIRYSDGGGAPDPLVDVLDLQTGETPEQGIQRVFATNTDAALVARCELAPYKEDSAPPAGIKRYTFVPNAALQKELDAKADPEEVPDPPCGDWGESADGIQYFEAQPASGVAKVLFVRIGQDEPLFDEQSLRLR